MPRPSKLDNEYFMLARNHIAAFRARWRDKVDRPVLEIGPEHDAPWTGADTMNILPGCTYEADITHRTDILTSMYATVIAMEVLDHVTDPFAAVREMERILRSDGILLVSAPWNFRIHGPQPDLWRFNQNTWRLVLKNFEILEMDVLDTPGRPLMPLHINVAARRSKWKFVNEVQFKRIDR